LIADVIELQEIISKGASADDLVKELRTIMDRFEKTSDPETETTGIADAVDGVAKMLLTPEEFLVPTGFPQIDRCIRNGAAPGEVVIIMAHAGVGKTAFVCNTLDRILARDPDFPTLVVSLEMAKYPIALRLMQVHHNATKEELRDNFKGTRDMIAPFMSRYRRLQISESGMLSDIERRIKNLKARAVFIDHLQFIKIDGITKRYELMATAVNEIKQIAKRTNSAIFLLSQVGREKGGAGWQRLPRDAARDAGQIEEVADVLISLWRPSMKPEGEEHSGGVKDEDEIHYEILKNRPTGETGTDNLVGRRTTFRLEEKMEYFDLTFNTDEERYR